VLTNQNVNSYEVKELGGRRQQEKGSLFVRPNLGFDADSNPSVPQNAKEEAKGTGGKKKKTLPSTRTGEGGEGPCGSKSVGIRNKGGKKHRKKPNKRGQRERKRGKVQEKVARARAVCVSKGQESVIAIKKGGKNVLGVGCIRSNRT